MLIQYSTEYRVLARGEVRCGRTCGGPNRRRKTGNVAHDAFGMNGMMYSV